MTLESKPVAIDELLVRATTTREVVIRRGAIAEVAGLVRNAWPARTARIVADAHTFALAGERVQASLRQAGYPVGEPVILPAEPALRPDFAHIARITATFDADTIPVAVGSGTINDLTKRSAFEAQLPYVVVATAASMDGYTAAGAALVRDGVKQTFDCPAPEIVVADLDIVRQAPRAMTASGYGDLVGKVTAGADWILADALGVEPILPDIWQMVQGPLRDMIAAPERLMRGDADAIEQLFLGLVTTGLAIQAAGSTRPASGSEHQFSHLWEMRGLEHNGELVSHGMKVGLGSIVSTTLYDRLLTRPLERLDVDAAVNAWPDWSGIEAGIRQTYNHPALVEKALEECRAKYMSPEDLRARLVLLRERWPELRDRLRGQLLPAGELTDLLQRAGCATTPEQIGLTREQLRESYLAAGQIRRRYTVYDIASEAGLLRHLVDELFAPGGYWAATHP